MSDVDEGWLWDWYRAERSADVVGHLFDLFEQRHERPDCPCGGTPATAKWNGDPGCWFRFDYDRYWPHQYPAGAMQPEHRYADRDEVEWVDAEENWFRHYVREHLNAPEWSRPGRVPRLTTITDPEQMRSRIAGLTT